MKPLITFLLFLSLAIPGLHASEAGIIEPRAVEQALRQLDDSLPLRDVFISRRSGEIRSLHSRFVRDSIHNIGLLHDIINRYSSFNNDSAIYYATIGQNITSGDEAMAFRLRAIALKPLSGFFETAMYEFDQIDSSAMSQSQLAHYYGAGRQMYSYIYGLFPTYGEFNDSIGHRLLDMQVKFINLLPENSIESKFYIGEYFMLKGQYIKAKAFFNELLNDSPETAAYRARIAHHLATIAHHEGNDDEYAYYLTLSALADLTSGTLEVKSLQELGSLMYARGDVDRAYNYLSIALENAVDCRAAMRMVESARSMPIIESAHSSQIDSWRRMIYVVIGIMVLMLVIMATLLILLRREMSRMDALQQNLRSANRAKEVYISQFMSLCSIYMDKLNNFSKMVNRKLSVGKVDDLYKLTNSGKFVEEQSREFYEVFDNAFLHIYPDFVSQVNALLRPDAQIELKEGEKLNTELRILAFLRMGIQDSPRIAQVLNYSLNTIYSYRNRLKNRAINRDSFEADIMNLSSL